MPRIHPSVQDSAPNPGKRVFFARHGQSIWNAEHRWAGQADPPLSETGRAQAREACRVLFAHRFDQVGSSTLARATETASIIASTLSLPQLAPHRAFDERAAGQISGLTSAEIQAAWPGLLDQWRLGRPVEMPGGEPWPAFVDRVVDGLGSLRAVPGRILVVSHMGVLRALEQVMDEPLSRYANLEGLWVAV